MIPFIVDRLLVVSIAALGTGLLMLAAGLAIYPESNSGVTPVVAKAADDRSAMSSAAASPAPHLGSERLRSEALARRRADAAVFPSTMASPIPGDPFSGRDPARPDRDHAIAPAARDDHGPVDYDALDDPRAFLLRTAARAHRRSWVNTANYPRAPQEELPLAPRIGGDEAAAGAYHAIVAAHTASG